MPRPSSTTQSALEPIALNAECGAPEWIMLIPAGPAISGFDGRKWTMADPLAVCRASDPTRRPISLDWEHASVVRADAGQDAPAAAWVTELEPRQGAIWGKVDWTPKARQQVTDKEYRFVSPAFTHTPDGKITRFVGGGLTNNPNLHMQALNRAEVRQPEPSETNVDLAARLRAALGLAADATEDKIVESATTILATNKAGVDLTRYAPREELSTAINRAKVAEDAVASRDAADRDGKIEIALNTAQAEGKITPASRPEYLAMCKADGGLERFEALAKTLPTLASSQGALLKPKETPGVDGGLTAEQLSVCKALGHDPVEYAKALKDA